MAGTECGRNRIESKPKRIRFALCDVQARRSRRRQVHARLFHNTRSMRDPRVEAAISHWAPRFVANGVPLADFQEVTASCERWEDWCRLWSARAAVHEELGAKAAADGYTVSAAGHYTRAAICYHFAKFLFVIDPAQMRRAHEKAVACRNRALPHLSPPGDRIAIAYEAKQPSAIFRKPLGKAKAPVVVMCMGLDSAKEEMDRSEERRV